jgi:hypothetical protein
VIAGSARESVTSSEPLGPLTYFNAVLAAFGDACSQSGGSIEHTFRIAGRTITYRFAGGALPPCIEPALAHLSQTSSEIAHGTLCLWDSASTSTQLPSMPWTPHDLVERNVIKGYNDVRFRAVYQPDSGALMLFDRERQLAVYWIASAATIAMHERAAPTRIPIHWFIESPTTQLVHAGAVGWGSSGVVLAGKGGAGKSTTAVRCLSAGLSFVGDDYIALSSNPLPFAWSVYSSAKLNEDSVQQIPGATLSISNPQRDESEKALLYLRDRYRGLVVSGIPIRAIVLPKVLNQPQTRLVPISRAVSMMTLAPGSLFYLPDTGPQAFHAIADLVKQVPSYTLEIGKNSEGIPDLIVDLLAHS